MIVEFDAFFTACNEGVDKEGRDYCNAWFVGLDNVPRRFKCKGTSIEKVKKLNIGDECHLQLSFYDIRRQGQMPVYGFTLEDLDLIRKGV